MKKLAIILGLLILSPAASYAGGTVLYMDAPGAQYSQQPVQYDPYSTYYTKDGVYGGQVQQSTKKSSKTSRKVRVGRKPQNDPNAYWNFGSVNFGSGFTSVGGGDKKY